MRRRDFVVRSAQVAAGFGILRTLGACAKAAPASSADAGFIAIRDHYFLKFLELNPVTSTYLGGDGYHASLANINGRLRDWSAAGVGVEAQAYRAFQTELKAINPATLSPVGQVDYRVLQAQLGFLLRQIDRRYHERAVDTFEIGRAHV